MNVTKVEDILARIHAYAENGRGLFYYKHSIENDGSIALQSPQSDLPVIIHKMCSIDINLKLYACTYLCIELLDVFVFILKNKMAFFLL